MCASFWCIFAINLRSDRETMHKLRDFYCDIIGLTVGKRVASMRRSR